MKTRLHKLICILTAAVMAAGLLSLPVHTALADTFVPLPGGTVKASSLTEAMYEIKGSCKTAKVSRRIKFQGTIAFLLIKYRG